jgi:O-antigen/teichoic acid export membrane protein
VLPAGAFNVCAVALGALVAVQAVADFGFSQAAVAALPNPGTLGRELPRDVLEAGIARLVVGGGGTALAGGCALALAVPANARPALVAIGPASALAVVVAGVDGILRARGEFRRPVLLVGASRLGALPAIGAGAATGSALLTCAVVSGGILIGSAPALAELRRCWRAADGRPAVRPLLRVAAPLGASNVCILASARINTIVLASAASVSSAAAFESAWRVFQAGQYVLGAAASAVAPFVAAGLSDDPGRLLHRRLRRTTWTMVLGGGLLGAAVVVLRHPLADLVAGGASDPVARSLLVLGAVLPASLLLLFATLALSAASARDRSWVLASYAAGAVVNVVVLLALERSSADTAGAAASAAAICVTLAILVLPFRRLLRRVADR